MDRRHALAARPRVPQHGVAIRAHSLRQLRSSCHRHPSGQAETAKEFEAHGPPPHHAAGPSPSSIFHSTSSFFYFLSLLIFAYSLMSKPMLVTLPFLLLDYWPLRRFSPAAPVPEIQGSRFKVQGSKFPHSPHPSFRPRRRYPQPFPPRLHRFDRAAQAPSQY
jgi:hypothetical protein